MPARHNLRVLDADSWRWLRLRAATATDLADIAPRMLKAHAIGTELYAVLETALMRQGARCRLVEGAAALLIASEEALHHTYMQAETEALRTLLSEALEALAHCRAPRCPGLRLHGTEFAWERRTIIMGIVNVTPDSFSGDGLLAPPAADEQSQPAQAGALSSSAALAGNAAAHAVAQGLRMLAEGADILDIGGESTRPGAQPVSEEEELARVIPILRALRAQTSAPLSVDTYRASVAEAAIEAGADLINDVWGLRMDPGMGPLVAARGATVVLMHNRSRPRDSAQEARLGGRYVGIHYSDLVADVLTELRAQVDWALACGIAPEHILIDPGIGFGKTVEQNLQLLSALAELRVLGYPVLLGASRKSFVGYTLNLGVNERLEGSLAAAVAGVLCGGADIVRVHDVQATVRAVRLAEAVRAAWGMS